MNRSIKYLVLCLTGSLLTFGMANAQISTTSDLFKRLKARDSILFEIGFNNCEVERSAALMADDLEFYHDKTGITRSKAEFVALMKNGLCNTSNTEQTYRFLVAHSLEVYPLYDNGTLYGALQNGRHFFSTDKTMTYQKSNNEAYFSHLWIIEHGEWRLKRVISYNHRSKDTKS